MDVVEFRPYKKLNDYELLHEAFNEMKKLKNLLKEQDDKNYLEETFIFNDIIIEIKKRDLRLDKKTLLRRILY